MHHLTRTSESKIINEKALTDCFELYFIAYRLLLSKDQFLTFGISLNKLNHPRELSSTLYRIWL